MTDYTYACNVICPVEHAALGNALAAGIDPGNGGNKTFTAGRGLACYPAGTTFTGTGLGKTASNPVSAYAAFPLLTALGYSRVAEFMSAGPYPLLNGLGFSDAQIAAGKAALIIEAGPRAQYESGGRAFAQSRGYVVP